jgi:hypothetical protein
VFHNDEALFQGRNRSICHRYVYRDKGVVCALLEDEPGHLRQFEAQAISESLLLLMQIGLSLQADKEAAENIRGEDCTGKSTGSSGMCTESDSDSGKKRESYWPSWKGDVNALISVYELEYIVVIETHKLLKISSNESSATF